MFLKTVPPVVAVHSEWRSGKSFSLPLCFNDSTSDSDSATTSGTPIPHKVQMIIDSLRSTQSSDMSDNPRATLDLPRHAGRKLRPCHTEALARPHRPASDDTKFQAPGLDMSESSDSDDSVDRGIEEAIQEYLKEKVDHKQGEAATNPVQGPRVERRDPSIPEPSKQLMHSNTNKVLTASNHIQKGSKADQPVAALKKKKKRPNKENPLQKPDAEKTSPTKVSSDAWMASSSCSLFAGRTPPPLKIKAEEGEGELPDSSSDDGIEEAIQRFQQEQKDLHEGARCPRPKEAPDSSTDDGIEEAIWHYQQEQQKEKKCKLLHPKPSPPAAMPRGKAPASPTDHTVVRPLKKPPKKKSGTKRVAAESEVKCSSPKALAASHSLGTATNATRGGGVEEAADRSQVRPTLSVNTTAELMCAEAILDISKTVMPAAFSPVLSLETPMTLPASLPPQPDGRSDDSSVDSEDGIEQEIQKFLELKAKMHEQLPTMAAVPSACSGGLVVTKAPLKKKDEDNDSKMLRLSLSRKRKRKEEDGRGEKRETTSHVIKKEIQGKPIGQGSSVIMTSHTHSPITVKHNKPKQSSPLYRVLEGSTSKEKGTCCGSASPPNALRPLTGSERNCSSDKSSSLDSDEDLDAAIKDLLKTKKKVKKKVRDMKLKARKSLKRPQALPTPETSKKPKPSVEQRSVLPAKPTKPCTPKCAKEPVELTGHEGGAKAKGGKPQQAAKKPKAPTQGVGSKMAGAPRPRSPTSDRAAEESSSVDSDDSIEQEIRRFLAEKAKGAVAPTTEVKDAGVGPEERSRAVESSVKVEEQWTPICASAGASWASRSAARPAGELQPQESLVTPMRAETCCIVGDRKAGGQPAWTSDEPRNGNADGGKVPEERPVVGPFCAGALGQQERVQHQNLFLMKPENCSMGDVRESTSTPLEGPDLPSSLQNRSRIPLREVISAVCPSPSPTARSSFGSPAQTHTVASGDRLLSATLNSRTDSPYLYSRVKRGGQWDYTPRLLPVSSHPPSNTRRLASSVTHRSPHLPPNPSHLSCVPLPPALSQPRLGASVVHLRRDQAAGVPPPARKPHPLQLRNRQEERERSDGREAEEQKCIDETDVESGEERRTGPQRTDKTQQPSSQSLSTCIDPGELLSPYIALDTEQRRYKFRHIQQVHTHAPSEIKQQAQTQMRLTVFRLVTASGGGWVNCSLQGIQFVVFDHSQLSSPRNTSKAAVIVVLRC